MSSVLRRPRTPSIQTEKLRKRIAEHHGTSTEKDEDVATLQCRDSMIHSICDPINETEKLKEYDLEGKDWEIVLHDLNCRIKSTREKMKEDITKEYGDLKRNALMSILVCHPPLELVKLLVEEGGENTVTRVSGCGYNAIHYACWGSASLEVITYLLDIGKKEALLEESMKGANPLHVACTRYKSTESNSLSDVIRLFIKVGGLDVITATDWNEEIPLQSLLLHHEPHVDSIITFLDEWYKLNNPEENHISNNTVIPSQTPDTSEEFFTANDNGVPEDTSIPSQTSNNSVENFIANDNRVLEEDNDFKDDAIHEALDKVIQQMLKTRGDVRSQILKSQFMKEYLTKRFIEPLPLAIIIMDLYVQLMIVCVFSFFINPNSPNPVTSTTINIILIICIIWRVLREMMQGMSTPFGAYFGDVSNWFDIIQIVLIILALGTNLDDRSTSSSQWVLIFAILFSWYELLLEIHNFQYSLALFVVAVNKIMKRMRIFLFTTFIFIAAFAHAYYISGPDNTELCNDVANFTKEDFNLAGGFTCTRMKSYEYSFFSLFAFEIPSGVPQWISGLYAFIMLILLLNIIIALVVTEFEDVLNESELTFWSDRLKIVNELDFCLRSFHSSSIPCLSLIHRRVKEWCKNWHKRFTEKWMHGERIDLNLFLENSIWDGLEKDDQDFLHWWYGKATDESDKPTLGVRLKFFLTYSAFEDIFIPASVFENLWSGNNRSHRCKRFERIYVLPFSFILMITSNALFAIMFVSGWLSFGALWPDIIKKRIFSVGIEKKRMISEVKKNNEEISATRKDIGKMIKISERPNNNEVISTTRDDIVNGLREEISEMRNEMKEILAGIQSLPERSVS